MFIKKLFNYFQSLLDTLSDMSLPVKIFYFSLIAVGLNIFVYKILLVPALGILFLALIFSFSFRITVHDLCLSKMLKVRYSRTPENTFDPIGVFLPLIDTIFNARMASNDILASAIVPLITWLKPVNINLRNTTTKKWKILFFSFINIIAHVLLAAVMLLIIKLAQGYNISMLLNPYFILFSKHMLSLNIGLALLNLLPIAPFDMGIALEHLGPHDLRVFITNTRPYGSLITLLFYYFNLIQPSLVRATIDVYKWSLTIFGIA